MKEAIVNPDLTVEIRDGVPTPVPTSMQILIKVACAGCNPKDWKEPFYSGRSSNPGDDIAGVVEAVGDGVLDFRPGDRVAAFHTMRARGGAFAKYGLAESWTTFHIPENITFEEGATIPLCAFTAAIALFWRLRMPMPWIPVTEATPLIVYGASTAVGSFTIKLALQSDVHPIIAVAGSGSSYVETLLDRSRGDAIVDYRNGSEHVIRGLLGALQAAGLTKAYHAVDTICEHDSYQTLVKALEPDGHITLLHPGRDYLDIPTSIKKSVTYAGLLNGDPQVDEWLREQESYGAIAGRKYFALVWSRLFTSGLRNGWLKGHPYEVLPGGLGALEAGLLNLRGGKASARKYVIRVSNDI